MRSEIETDRETDSNESVRVAGQQETILNNGEILSFEDLSLMEKVIFGTSKEETVSSELEWKDIKSDNYLIKSLKEMAGFFAQAVKKEVETKEKEIKAARKLFYGK